MGQSHVGFLKSLPTLASFQWLFALGSYDHIISNEPRLARTSSEDTQHYPFATETNVIISLFELELGFVVF